MELLEWVTDVGMIVPVYGCIELSPGMSLVCPRPALLWYHLPIYILCMIHILLLSVVYIFMTEKKLFKTKWFLLFLFNFIFLK